MGCVTVCEPRSNPAAASARTSSHVMKLCASASTSGIAPRRLAGRDRRETRKPLILDRCSCIPRRSRGRPLHAPSGFVACEGRFRFGPVSVGAAHAQTRAKTSSGHRTSSLSTYAEAGKTARGSLCASAEGLRDAHCYDNHRQTLPEPGAFADATRLVSSARTPRGYRRAPRAQPIEVRLELRGGMMVAKRLRLFLVDDAVVDENEGVPAMKRNARAVEPARA